MTQQANKLRETVGRRRAEREGAREREARMDMVRDDDERTGKR